MNKKLSRLRRARKTRSHIKYLRATRLCINRTPRHIYAQVIAPDGGTVLASASTLDKELRAMIKISGNTEAAAVVGKAVAERARRWRRAGRVRSWWLQVPRSNQGLGRCSPRTRP
jgi:large subunit ribosomal protein L18